MRFSGGNGLQARNAIRQMALAFQFKGDPNLLGIAKQSIKQMVGAWWSKD